MTMSRYLSSLMFVHDEASIVFGASQIDDGNLVTFRNKDKLLLFAAAERYPANKNSPKRSFAIMSFAWPVLSTCMFSTSSS